MIHIKAPDNTDFNSFARIFLAGSISGKGGLGTMADNWQEKVAKSFEGDRVIITNPRRDDWDASWTHDPTPGTQFEQQVSWELANMERADVVAFYFDPETQAPITLLELGLCLGNGKPVVIYCPKEFWRHGNVAVTVSRYRNVKLHDNFDEFVADIRQTIWPSSEDVTEETIEEPVEPVTEEVSEETTEIVSEDTSEENSG